MKIRIYYEDTDAAGIVYYVNYLKFCERARSEPFFEAGRSPQEGAGYFVVKSVQAEYLRSAKLGDLVEVRTRMVEKRSASIVLYQTVVKEEEVLFAMTIRLAYLREGRPAKIPTEIYSLLSSWEKTDGSSEDVSGSGSSS